MGQSWRNKISEEHIRSDMHNIRPAGQMWPAGAFDLARNAPACFFDKTLFECVTIY